MKSKLFTIISIFLSLSVFGQTNDIDCKLASLFVAQKTGEFGKYVDSLTVILDKKYSSELQFKRMQVRHFYIAYLLFNDSKSKQIEVQLDGMGKDIEDLEKVPLYEYEIIAFKAAYSAYSALDNPATAIWYLPKSFSLAKDATKKSADSPYSWAEYGNLEYSYTLFLGGKFNEAIYAYKKAINLFEKYDMANKCNWYYINTLLFLAKSYEDNKQYKEANTVYDKILNLRPDYEAIHRWKHKI